MTGTTPDHNGRSKGAAPIDFIVRLIDRACIASAGFAGVIILMVATTVTLSVTMRYIGIGGIRGDFELVEIGCGIAAFLFLPLCQRKGNHVMVDIFSIALPERTRNRLDQFWEFVFGMAWVILTWRIALGLVDMYDYNDRSMLLRVPTWIVYAIALFGLGLSALTALTNMIEQFLRPTSHISRTDAR
ncbi:MAG: TRAP transporter small permease [Thalassospira sp.]|uniref:TRAP transporter small permease n=1 Tax=Thalassospira sp. TaxID=1912094 RepID=UPI0032EBD4F1